MTTIKHSSGAEVRGSDAAHPFVHAMEEKAVMAQQKKTENRKSDARDSKGGKRIVIPNFLTLADDLSPADRAAPGALLEIRGKVLEIKRDEGFVLKGGLVVRTSADTRYIGVQASEVEPGTPLQIEGTLGSDGAVIAERVMLRRRGHNNTPENE